MRLCWVRWGGGPMGGGVGCGGARSRELAIAERLARSPGEWRGWPEPPTSHLSWCTRCSTADAPILGALGGPNATLTTPTTQDAEDSPGNKALIVACVPMCAPDIDGKGGVVVTKADAAAGGKQRKPAQGDIFECAPASSILPVLDKSD